MTLDEALGEWYTKRRKMGCVSATNWLCKRVPNYTPLRLTRYTLDGSCYQHVVAYNGLIVIDLAPYADAPRQ